VSYAVDDVTTRGTSVVHRAQQRFFPSRRQDVTVPLLLFDVRFGARDALFGNRAGSAIKLEYPDGTSRRLPFDRHGGVTVRNLPRGTYHARVAGAGPEYGQQLTVSRSTRIDLDALTWLDTALLVGLVVVVVVALLLAGFALRRRNRRRVELDLVAVEKDERSEPELAGAS
jgi:hypothetical protein